MSFKVGDRVKVVKDEDALGYLGQIGKVFSSDFTDDTIPVEFDSGNEAYFWEHELQLIPLAIADQKNDSSIIETMKSMVPQEVRDAMNEQEFEEIMEIVEPFIDKREERGLRHDAGKPEIHQVPTSLIIAVAEVLKYGESKYAKGNWKKGMDWVKPYDCLMRHMFKWLQGEETDEESGLSHLYHAAANIAMLIEYKETCPELDNREF